jgi:hypothetical protein
LIDEHIVRDSHILKLNILGCDSNQVCLIASPVLACVLDCACRDKPSWRGHSCDTGDNQWRSGIVIAGFCSFGALDHQR